MPPRDPRLSLFDAFQGVVAEIEQKQAQQRERLRLAQPETSTFQTILKGFDYLGEISRTKVFGPLVGATPQTGREGLAFGQESIFGEDIFRELAGREPEAFGFNVDTAAVLGIEIITDPFTFLGIGAASRTGQAVRHISNLGRGVRRTAGKAASQAGKAGRLARIGKETDDLLTGLAELRFARNADEILVLAKAPSAANLEKIGRIVVDTAGNQAFPMGRVSKAAEILGPVSRGQKSIGQASKEIAEFVQNIKPDKRGAERLVLFEQLLKTGTLEEVAGIAQFSLVEQAQRGLRSALTFGIGPAKISVGKHGSEFMFKLIEAMGVLGSKTPGLSGSLGALRKAFIAKTGDPAIDLYQDVMRDSTRALGVQGQKLAESLAKEADIAIKAAIKSGIPRKAAIEAETLKLRDAIIKLLVVRPQVAGEEPELLTLASAALSGANTEVLRVAEGFARGEAKARVGHFTRFGEEALSAARQEDSVLEFLRDGLRLQNEQATLLGVKLPQPKSRLFQDFDNLADLLKKNSEDLLDVRRDMRFRDDLTGAAVKSGLKVNELADDMISVTKLERNRVQRLIGGVSDAGVEEILKDLSPGMRRIAIRVATLGRLLNRSQEWINAVNSPQLWFEFLTLPARKAIFSKKVGGKQVFIQVVENIQNQIIAENKLARKAKEAGVDFATEFPKRLDKALRQLFQEKGVKFSQSEIIGGWLPNTIIQGIQVSMKRKARNELVNASILFKKNLKQVGVDAIPIKDVIKELGAFKLGAMPKDLLKIERMTGKALFMSRDDFNLIKRSIDLMADPNSFENYNKLLDGTLSVYRRFLLLGPGFHTRNAGSDLVQMYLGGMGPVDGIPALARGFQLIRKHATGTLDDTKEFIRTFDGTILTEKAFVDIAIERGVIGSGAFFDQELRRFGRQGPSGLKAAFKTGDITEVNRQFGKYLEEHRRISFFLFKLRKGDSIDGAAMSVKKFLFQYDELTTFERTILRRAFIFPKWITQNVPLQLRAAIETPGRQAAQVRLLVDRNPETPDYFSNTLAGKVRMSGGDAVFFTALGVLPLEALSDFTPDFREPLTQAFSNPFRQLISQSNPFFRLPVEMGLGRRAFRGGLFGEARIVSAGPIATAFGLRPTTIGRENKFIFSGLINEFINATPFSRVMSELLNLDRTLASGNLKAVEKFFNILGPIKFRTFNEADAFARRVKEGLRRKLRTDVEEGKARELEGIFIANKPKDPEVVRRIRGLSK